MLPFEAERAFFVLLQQGCGTVSLRYRCLVFGFVYLMWTSKTDAASELRDSPFLFLLLLFSFNQCQLEAKAHSVISAHYHCMDTEKQTSSFSRLSFSLFSLFAMSLFNCCTAPSGCCVYMCTNLRHHWSCALFLWAFLLFAVFPGVWLASHFKSMLLFLV